MTVKLKRYLHHPQAGNFAKFRPIPSAGYKCGWATDRMYRVHAGHFITYRFPLQDEKVEDNIPRESDLYIARAVALATHGGDGSELDPHHLMVYEINQEFSFCYTRFIHPNWVYSAQDPQRPFAQWYMTTEDFNFDKLELLLRMEKYGVLKDNSVDFGYPPVHLNAWVDDNNHLNPPRQMQCWPSQYIDGYMLIEIERDFEDYLAMEEYVRMEHPSAREAETLVDYFLQRTLHLGGEDYRVRELAKQIGKIVKADALEEDA